MGGHIIICFFSNSYIYFDSYGPLKPLLLTWFNFDPSMDE